MTNRIVETLMQAGFLVCGSALLLTACSAGSANVEAPRPGEISGGSSDQEQAAKQDDQQKDESSPADAASAEPVIPPVSDDERAAILKSIDESDLPEEVTGELKCPELPSAPEGLSRSEIRDWGCEKLFGDKDAPSNLGEQAVTGETPHDMACYAFSLGEENKPEYYCWNERGEKLGSFKPGWRTPFDARVVDIENTPAWAEKKAATHNTQLKGERACQRTLYVDNTRYRITDTDNDGSVDQVRRWIFDPQGRLLRIDKTDRETGELEPTTPRVWKGNTFEEFRVVSDGENQLSTTGKSDDAGRILELKSTGRLGQLEKYKYDAAGRKIWQAQKRVGKDEWKRIEEWSYDSRGRLTEHKASTPNKVMWMRKTTYGPHGPTSTEVQLNEFPRSEKYSYDDSGRLQMKVEATSLTTYKATKVEWNDSEKTMVVKQREARIEDQFAPAKYTDVEFDWSPDPYSDQKMSYGCFVE